jgi:c-di-GMP-binding flagellar brake protein YcgR
MSTDAPLCDEVAALGTQDGSAFVVDQPQQCLALLRQLRDSNASIQLTTPAGPPLHTTLWSVDDVAQRLNFSADRNILATQALLENDEATAVAYLQQVKLQFEVLDLLLVQGHGASTLQCRLPSHLYRFQRRSAFRVRTAGRHGPVVRLRHPSLPDMQLELRVLDLSVGGCSLWLPGDLPPLQPGTLLSQVSVQLDLETVFAAELSLQHVSAMGDSTPGGARLGCAWRPLNGGGQRNLQRWIDHTQKRQRLLNAG